MNPSPLTTQFATAACLVLATVIGLDFFTRHLPKIRTLAVVLFVVQLAVGTAFYLSAPLAHDALAYDNQASAQAGYWAGEFANAPALHAGKQGFPLMMAAIYFAIGRAPFVGIVINAAMLSFCAPLIYRTAVHLGAAPQRAGRAAAFLFAPNFLLWGGSFLRESSSWLGAAMIISGAVALGVREALGPNLGLLFGGAALSYWVRSSTGIVTIGAAFLVLFLLSRAAVPTRIMTAAVALAVLPTALSYAQETQLGDQAQLQMSRNELAASGSGFASGVGSIPMGLLRVLFGPLPWEWGAISKLYLVDYAVWITILLLVAHRAKIKRETLFILGPALGFTLSLAVSSGNYGTMVRLRSTLALMLIPLVALTPRRGLRAFDRFRRQRSAQSPTKVRSRPSRSRVSRQTSRRNLAQTP